MAGHDHPPRYQAYLLRCWQERSRQEAQTTLWRFSLEDPHTGHRRGFTSLQAVVEALQQDIAAGGTPSPAVTCELIVAQNKQEDQ